MTSFLRIKSQQEEMVYREKRATLLPHATIEQFKNGKWPVGSKWLSTIGAVGPPGSGVQPDKRSGE